MGLKPKTGYCHGCVKNVPHVRHFETRFFYILDFLFGFRILGLFGIGPWICVQCFERSLLRKSKRKTAPDYRNVDKPNSEKTSSRRKNNAVQNPANGIPSNGAFESAGNYLKSSALAVRSKRLKRFSDKYRDSVIRKILNGSSTISEVRHDTNLSESEIVDWIADRFNRMDKEIEHLGSQLAAALGESLPNQDFSHAEFSDDSVAESFEIGSLYPPQNPK